jgi:Ser-tRNA(Ala) deacylase AlaX
MAIKVPKEKIQVKIRTNSSILRGYIYIMTGGRIVDYINAQNNKFIPITEAEIYPLEESPKTKINIIGKNEIVFLNVEDIEMVAPCGGTHKEDV